MKLWDKVWTTIFLILIMVFTATIAYELFYIKGKYLKAEEERMDKVAQSYEIQLKDYLYNKVEIAKTDYISNGRPIVNKLKSQDIFVFIEGENSTWNKMEGEEFNFDKSDKGYFVSTTGLIYGYAQEMDGSTYIFKLDKRELVTEPKWGYYDVTIEPHTGSSDLDEDIKLEYDYFEKRYFFPAEGRSISITIRRAGVLYNSVVTEGRKVFMAGLAVLAFVILIIASYTEKRIAGIIKNAAKKMESVIINDEASGDINLGRIPEFKILEKGLNKIVKDFKDKKRKYKLLYGDLPLFSAILDMDLNIIEENSYFEKNLKKPGEEKSAFLDYVPKDKVNLFTAIYRKLEESGEVLNENFYMTDNNSNTRMVMLTLKKVTVDDGKEVILFTGIDAESLDIRQLESRSSEKYDTLTNVYTEKYGHYYLDKYINMCKISNFNFLSVVLWTDFEKLANKLSDDQRIEYLKIMAASIKRCLRGTDMIYKYDRNSFVILLSMVNRSEIDIILKRIKRELNKSVKVIGIEKEMELSYSVTEYDSLSSKKFFIEQQYKNVEAKKKNGDKEQRIKEEKLRSSKRS